MAIDVNGALERMAKNAKAGFDKVFSTLDSHDSRLKAVETYQGRLDAAAKKRVTTERARELKTEGNGEA